MTEHQDSRDYVRPDTGEIYVPKEDLENCEAELRRCRGVSAMAEWPRYFHPAAEQRLPVGVNTDTGVFVVPADLAGELYEALKQAEAIVPGLLGDPMIRPALASYERICGND